MSQRTLLHTLNDLNYQQFQNLIMKLYEKFACIPKKVRRVLEFTQSV